jgi:hypothetical protein
VWNNQRGGRFLTRKSGQKPVKKVFLRKNIKIGMKAGNDQLKNRVQYLALLIGSW